MTPAVRPAATNGRDIERSPTASTGSPGLSPQGGFSGIIQWTICRSHLMASLLPRCGRILICAMHWSRSFGSRWATLNDID
jgi:hypothetical protein